LYSSTDNGINWTEVNMGWAGQSAIMSLATKDNYIYAGTYEDDFFYSSNAGDTWNHIELNNSGGVFEVGVIGNNVICYTNGSGPIWISTNSGVNFSNAGNASITTTNGFLTVGDVMYSASRYGMFYTTNGGFNWVQPLNNGMPSHPDGSKPSTSLLYENGRIYANVIDKILYTTNNGSSWSATSITLANYSSSYSMVAYGGRIYAALYGLNDGERGVLMTSNGGDNWQLMNNGLPFGTSIRTLFVNNEYLLAGTYMKGVYRISLSTLTAIKNENFFSENYLLKQNFPNPFNPVTKINYTIKEKGFVSIKVYDSMGKEVSSLINSEMQAGNYFVNFTAENLSSGIYFYKLEAGNFSDTKKMILLK